jgi:hypothetical protein
MTPQLTPMQLWTLISAGPIAMILTVLVSILVNNGVMKSEIAGVEGVLRGELQHVEGVPTARIDALVVRESVRR